MRTSIDKHHLTKVKWILKRIKGKNERYSTNLTGCKNEKQKTNKRKCVICSLTSLCVCVVSIQILTWYKHNMKLCACVFFSSSLFLSFFFYTHIAIECIMCSCVLLRKTSYFYNLTIHSTHSIPAYMLCRYARVYVC